MGSGRGQTRRVQNIARNAEVGSVLVVDRHGKKEWRLGDENGPLHRLDGPARIRPGGTEEWFVNGEYHRDGGPAITWINGTSAWYKNGKYHRVDAPAYEIGRAHV